MNAIDGKEEVDSEDVCGSSDMIECEHPECKETFKFNQKYPSKKYHSTTCKNAHHKMERVAGQKVLARGVIHAALMENSPRLRRVAWFLSDRKPHSTREIVRECDVCAIPAIKAELIHPKNKLEIECKRKGDYYYYTLTGGFEQLLRIVK